MSDDVLLCARTEKAAGEAANGVEQIDYLTEMVVHRQQKELRGSHILELQSLAVSGIYPCGGTYRDALNHIYIEGSKHTPPEPALVANLVSEMVDKVNADVGKVPALVPRRSGSDWFTRQP